MLDPQIEWTHKVIKDSRLPFVDVWEHWPDPEWRWFVSHTLPREPKTDLQKVVAKRVPPEEYFTWSVAFQGGDFERWRGADQWIVGGVCFSEAEAKDACRRVWPKIYELWLSTQPLKH